jgi:hypothetical protein
MIDIESEVFTLISERLKTDFAGIFVSGESVASPSDFPAVTIVEIDNSTYERSIDSSYQENHASLLYQVDIYSNKTSGKKTQCRTIAATIDSIMFSIGFTRTVLEPSTIEVAGVYRVISRYKAIVSNEKMVYHI